MVKKMKKEPRPALQRPGHAISMPQWADKRKAFTQAQRMRIQVHSYFALNIHVLCDFCIIGTMIAIGPSLFNSVRLFSACIMFDSDLDQRVSV